MSEMPPEQGGQAQGNFLTHKYGGIPGIVWLAGAAAVAYFLFFRNKGGGSTGAQSTGGGGTSTTGDITLTPGTETIDLGAPSGNVVSNPAPVDTGEDNEPNQPSQSGTPNPQPMPFIPPRKKKTGVQVQHKAGAPVMVTVAQWPGRAEGGLAQWNTTLWGIAKHYNTTVAQLLKLNPSITNPSLIHPGQRIRVK